jgi:hypothetical protein
LLTCCNLCYPLSWHQIGADIDGGAVNVLSGYSVSLSSDGSRMAIGAPGNYLNTASYSGRVRVYEWNADILPPSWQQVGDDIDGEAVDDESGSSVSLSGDGSVLAIGAPWNDGNGIDAGKVRVYEWNADTSDWEQKGQGINGEAEGDLSGSSVSLSRDGTILAIGAPWNGSYSGHVRVYEWNADTSSWDQKGLDIDGEADGDNSGRPVSLSSDGTVVAIGAYGNDANGADSGHVRVYEWNFGTYDWEQRGSDIDGEATYDWSGESVSLSSDGTILAIGAPRNDGNGADLTRNDGEIGTGSNTGHVRVYEWKANIFPPSWVQKGDDIDGEAAGDESGYSVSLSGDGTILAIGAPWNGGEIGTGSNTGHVRVYEWNDGTSSWQQQGTDIDGEAADDRSGSSVSLSGDGTVLAIGAINNIGEIGTGSNTGHVRVYKY